MLIVLPVVPPLPPLFGFVLHMAELSDLLMHIDRALERLERRQDTATEPPGPSSSPRATLIRIARAREGH